MTGLALHMWLWLWFSVGTALYILKRAYYLVTGPNPIANNYLQFWQRCWIPLLCRTGVDAGVYWLSFYPDLFNYLLKMSPWQIQIHSALPQYAVFALFFGMGIDSIIDFGVTRVPWLKDWWPQMPGPLPTPPPTDSQVTKMAEDKTTPKEGE